MTVLATFSAHINDWKVLLDMHHDILLPRARELGATRYRVFRNVKNAGEVLIAVELPAYEDAQDMAQFLRVQQLPLLLNAVGEQGIWEDMGWEEIGP